MFIRLQRFTVVAMALMVATYIHASEGDAGQAVRAVEAFHERLAAGDAAGAAALLGPTLFIADERTSGGDRLSVHFFRTGPGLVAWPAGYLKEVGPHANSANVLSVSHRGDGAVVITRNSGSNKFRKWENEEVAWFLGKVEGRWRIVSVIYRDIQLPE